MATWPITSLCTFHLTRFGHDYTLPWPCLPRIRKGQVGCDQSGRQCRGWKQVGRLGKLKMARMGPKTSEARRGSVSLRPFTTVGEMKSGDDGFAVNGGEEGGESFVMSGVDDTSHFGG